MTYNPMPAPEALSGPTSFAPGKPRARRIELQWPIEHGGRTYAAVTVQRVSTDRIAAWSDAVRRKEPDANLGNVVDDDGLPIPAAVLDFLDPDDDEEVGEAIQAFLPRRLRAAFAAQPETSTSS